MNSADEIKADIEVTRAELAETADALAARLDTKARAGKRILLAVAGVAAVIVIVQRIRK
jgi:Protein of unknown function (DUF3618)